MAEVPPVSSASSHPSLIADQFARQAELFARAPELHNEAALALLVDAAQPTADSVTLDVACGPGTVVAAFARRVRYAIGLDATDAMLRQAQQLACTQAIHNAAWSLGDVYALPFGSGAFDVVSCRFAFHHLQRPAAALDEMRRVCRPGGRIVLCDALASDDPVKAAAFNRMERHRDPSTVEFRPLSFLLRLFAQAHLPEPSIVGLQVPAEREQMIARSFPAGDDRALLRRMIDESVDGDAMGLNARRVNESVQLAYPSVILVAAKPGPAGIL
jgi:SAM-dependent methyltransferase